MSQALLRSLLLEGAERAKLTLTGDDLLNAGGTQGADQLVFQVCDAHIEVERFHFGAGEVGAAPGSIESALEGALLSGVAKTGQSDVNTPRAEQIEELSDVRCSAKWNDRDAFGVKIATTAYRESLERALVADSFNEHDRTGLDDGSRRMCCRATDGITSASRRPDSS